MQEVQSVDKGDISSKEMHEAVLNAFKMQRQRGQRRLNGKLNEEEIESYCLLDDASRKILEGAIGKFGLSHRSIASVKKIGRTVADLNGYRVIEKGDLLEALSY